MTMNRLYLSAGWEIAFMEEILAEMGVPLEKNLAIKSTYTAGSNFKKSSPETNKTIFTALKHPTLHWDSKLLPGIRKDNKERLAIFVSCMLYVEEG